MSEERRSDVLGSLPHSRTHRRSEKRPARPTDAPTSSPNGNGAKQSEPAGARAGSDAEEHQNGRVHWDAPGGPWMSDDRDQQPTSPGDDKPGTPLLATAVEAAAELAEICLSLSARAIRAALSRLPRP